MEQSEEESASVNIMGKQLIGGDDGHRSEQDIAAGQHFHKRSLFGMTIQM